MILSRQVYLWYEAKNYIFWPLKMQGYFSRVLTFFPTLRWESASRVLK